MTFKNLNLETLQRDSVNFQLSENDSYLTTYPYFLKYFKDIDEIKEEHLVISSHFVYGWMPTILYLDLDQKDKVLTLLNMVKCGHIINQLELEILKKSINNSLVGVSKLLHFINPKEYAIWDSRILRYLTEKKTSYGIGNPELYLEYLKGIKEIIENSAFSKLHSTIEGVYGDKIYPTRAIEILMFQTDKVRQTSIRENSFVNKSEKVFQMAGEGGSLTISRQKNRFKEKFIYHHGEFDPSDEGLDLNKQQEFDSFEAAFKLIDKGYVWQILTIEMVHNDFRDYVIEKLIQKLNENTVELEYYNYFKEQFEDILKIKLICKLDNNKQIWSYK